MVDFGGVWSIVMVSKSVMVSVVAWALVDVWKSVEVVLNTEIDFRIVVVDVIILMEIAVVTVGFCVFVTLRVTVTVLVVVLVDVHRPLNNCANSGGVLSGLFFPGLAKTAMGANSAITKEACILKVVEWLSLASWRRIGRTFNNYLFVVSKCKIPFFPSLWAWASASLGFTKQLLRHMHDLFCKCRIMTIFPELNYARMNNEVWILRLRLRLANFLVVAHRFHPKENTPYLQPSRWLAERSY